MEIKFANLMKIKSSVKDRGDCPSDFLGRLNN